LAVPAEEGEEDDLLRCGALRLFRDRVRAARPHFPLDRHSTAMIATICRRLDGIPLAIELAAARAAALDVAEIAARMGDRFRLLTGGRRTALTRHQTLRATLDWSHELLAEPERVILRRLAIFNGHFSLEAAIKVVASPEMTPWEVVDGLSSLVAKSLVSADVERRIARYRLLDTTRAYCLEKLSESGERERLARRYAENYPDLFERVESGGQGSLPASARPGTRQGALSWELRAATSPARLLGDQDCPADASTLPQPVYDGVIEGSTPPISGRQERS
ncbi:MAG: hypothetical protein JOY66_16450, partial [Acetobacteraceae bacterium]|nr:hypothetical protein [Acetobacteraceae bacterium]